MISKNKIKVKITKKVKEMINYLLQIFQLVGMILNLKVFFLNLVRWGLLMLLMIKLRQDLLLLLLKIQKKRLLNKVLKKQKIKCMEIKKILMQELL